MTRVEIEKKCNPDAAVQYIQTLKATHIDEDNYFAHMIHDDMDAIAKDIRSTHTKDFYTTLETSVTDIIREGIEAPQILKEELKRHSYFFCAISRDWTTVYPQKNLLRSRKP